MVSRNQGNHNQRPNLPTFKPTHVRTEDKVEGHLIAESDNLVVMLLRDGSIQTNYKYWWEGIVRGAT